MNVYIFVCAEWSHPGKAQRWVSHAAPDCTQVYLYNQITRHSWPGLYRANRARAVKRRIRAPITHITLTTRGRPPQKPKRPEFSAL